MKIEIWKSESSKQYISANRNITICATTGAWRKRKEVSKGPSVMMFYGGAWGDISRKFAADILRQFRREASWKAGAR